MMLKICIRLLYEVCGSIISKLWDIGRGAIVINMCFQENLLNIRITNYEHSVIACQTVRP